MTPTSVFLLAFLIGGVCGLRSMTAPAAVCWGAHLGWLQLDGSKLGFLHNPISLVFFTLFALGEMAVDKLPKTPNRTAPGPLAVRIIFGAFCGAALCAAAGLGILPGIILGAFGGIAGTFGGYHVRRWLTVGRGLPDIVIALLEDAIAIGGGLLIVSRF